MNLTRTTTASLFSLLILFACNEAQEAKTTADITPPQEKAKPTGPVIAPEGATFNVMEANPAADFPNAALSLDDIKVMENGNEAKFTMSVSGFDLKQQTPDAPERGCANSPDGQHIHYILNNKPYLAKYEAAFTAPVDPGHNVLLAFLSRSYHESVKGDGAFVLKEFDAPGEGTVADLGAEAHLFYSRPKGEYKKSEGDKVLLDFYLLNTDLSMDGHRVRATIDGQSFILTKWAPYFIEGLGLGEHKVRLELIDASGALIPGPFNDSGERPFHVLEG